MFKVTSSGSFKNTEDFFKRMQRGNLSRMLRKYGVKGIDALSNATPEDTGETARSWKYTITDKPGEVTIGWHNTHEESGQPIAVLIQYGHGTRNGGYVVGRDFINPAIQPIFDKIVDDVWKEMTK